MVSEICEIMEESYKRGWITSRDGNCSLRFQDEDEIFITPSGVRKNKILPSQIISIKVAEGNLILPENIKPSGELEMHWQLLKDTSGTRCVLHLHPTNIVAAMYAGLDLNEVAKDFPEVFRYTRVGPNVPKLPAISQELADQTSLKLGLRDGVVKYDIVGQANHGVCAVGRNPRQAFEHIERLEHICQIVLAAGV